MDAISEKPNRPHSPTGSVPPEISVLNETDKCDADLIVCSQARRRRHSPVQDGSGDSASTYVYLRIGPFHLALSQKKGTDTGASSSQLTALGRIALKLSPHNKFAKSRQRINLVFTSPAAAYHLKKPQLLDQKRGLRRR